MYVKGAIAARFAQHSISMVMKDYDVILHGKSSIFCEIIAKGLFDSYTKFQAHRYFTSAFIRAVSIIFSHPLYPSNGTQSVRS